MEGVVGGYDYDVADDGVYDDFYCPICTKLLRDAVELECEHTLCSSCLNEWEKNTQLEFNCPECRRPIDRTRVQNSGGINRIIRRSIRVKCEKKSDGCEWIGVIIDMKERLQMRCLYFTIPCEHDGCTELVQRIDMNTHRLNCLYRNIDCQYCAIIMRLVDEKDHLLICDLFPVECENEGCGDVIPRQLLSNHYSNYCTFQLTECQYSGVGCNAKLPRLQIDQHEKEFMTKHMSLMLQKNLFVQKELEDTKQNLEQTKQKLQSTTIELQQSREDLQITKDILQITNQELEHAKATFFENYHKSSTDFEVKYFAMLIRKELKIGLCNWDQFLQSSTGFDNFETITKYLELSYNNCFVIDGSPDFQEKSKTVRELFEKHAAEHNLTSNHTERLYGNFVESAFKDGVESYSVSSDISNTISQFLRRFVGEKDDKFYDTSRVLLRTIEFCEGEDLHDDWTLLIDWSTYKYFRFDSKRKTITIPRNSNVHGVAVMRPLWNIPFRLRLRTWNNKGRSYFLPVKSLVENGCGEFSPGKLFIIIKFVGLIEVR